jgi:lipopolysaccharide/colanic/teichoic acid biosynthesis glycosyltransferase
MQSVAHVEIPPIELRSSTWYRASKRLFDLVVASLLVLVLSPVFLVCAFLVWRGSPGPILFRQPRVGVQGREFTFLKFRSMRVDADPTLHREYVAKFINGEAEQQTTEKGSMFKLVEDPRVTRSGSFLRRTSLDELPQLFNVVRGNMSLVGPRPPIPYELEHYRPEHYRRLAAKPGITGLWQVSGRSHTTFEEMIALDLEYIRSASLLTDLRLLIRTIPVVLNQHGAQ